MSKLQVLTMDMSALITGATGFIGRELGAHLPRVKILSRSPDRARRLLHAEEVYEWQPERSVAPTLALEGVDAIFHLAGEPIADGRWSREKKKRIMESRRLGTRNLVAGIASMNRPPRVLVSASAVGYYGDTGQSTLDETSPKGFCLMFVALGRRSHESHSSRLRIVRGR
jgi:NAD dependent epimerase/dehydratase family enzyme